MMGRKISLSLFAAFLACTTVFSQELPEIRTGHPRMFFNADTWPEVNKRAHGRAREALDKLLADVDKMTDNPVAENTGAPDMQYGRQADGSIISNGHSPIVEVKEFGKEAAKCALAWRFTGDDEYLQKAKKMLGVSIAAYTEATANRRPVNWYSTGRILALCAYDWIYEALSPEERRGYIVPLLEHVRLVQGSAGLKIPRQPDGNKSTGFYGMASLLWYAGLAAYGDGFDDELAETFLKDGYQKEIEMLEYRNESAGDDGGHSTPALNYAGGAYPFAHFNFFHTYLSATGKNIAEDYPGLGLFPNWVWWLWIHDDEKGYVRHHGLGDIYHDTNVHGYLLWGHMAQYIHFFKNSNPEAARLASVLMTYFKKQQFDDTFPVYPFLIETSRPASEKDVMKVERASLKARYFESFGQLFMRSGWGPEATYCSFTGGTPGGMQHKQFDEGSFTIYKYDHLALDTGERGKQNDLNLRYYYGQSVAHNVFLVHKPGEKLPFYWGPKSDRPEDEFNYGGMTGVSSDMVGFETGKDFTYAAVDLAKAYGDKVTEATRQFVFVYPNYFIVYDRVTSSDPSYNKEWLLHMKNKPVVKGNLTRFDSHGGRLFCETFLPQDARIEKVGGPGHEFQVGERNFEINPKVMKKYQQTADRIGRGPYTGAWRIELKAPENQAEVRFLNVLTAASSAAAHQVGAKYSSDAQYDCITLTVKGKKMTFRFNRTGEIGGTVTIGKQTRALVDKVQPQAGIIYE